MFHTVDALPCASGSCTGDSLIEHEAEVAYRGDASQRRRAIVIATGVPGDHRRLGSGHFAHVTNMPASFIGELILRPILEAVFHVAAYYVGRVVVPVMSFGRWKCDRLLRDVPKKKLSWGGLYHLRGQQIYLTADATALVGLPFSALVIALGLWLYFRG